MYLPAAHLIQKQVLEVTFQGRKEPMDLPVQLSELTKDKLLPILEKLLDQLQLKDLIIQIENVELDLGELSAGNWKTELAEKLEKQFKNALNEKLNLVTDAGGVSDSIGVQVLTSQEATWDVFLYFLKTGMLPGTANYTSPMQLEYDVTDLLLKKENLKYSQQLDYLLLQDGAALERFLLQFSAEFSNVAWSCLGYQNDEKSSLIENLPLSGRQRHIVHFSYSLCTAAGAIKAPAAVQVLAKVLKTIEAGEKIIPDDFNLIVPANKSSAAENKYKTERPEELYIKNAGLVLLHPFLQNLLQGVGYISDDYLWKKPECHRKAVLLTQYLVTGEKEIPEYELALNKILCGYPLADSLEKELIVSELEMEEAEQLLLAVIRHWQALKNTSIHGFRSTFLNRSGKLSRTDKGWLLQVEHQTWDVLLDMLPWGIGIIKNRLMQDWLYVEWM